MAVTLNSTPTPTYTGFIGTQTATVTSTTFSPPANSLIIVVVNAYESFNNVWGAATATDSLGSHLTWTVEPQADSTQSVGGVWVAYAQCPSAQTNMTVSVSLDAGSGQYVFLAELSVIVQTGAHATTPIVNITKGTAAASPCSASITPSNTGSALMLAVTKIASTATADTAGTGMYLSTVSNHGTASMDAAWYGTVSGFTATTSGSAVAQSVATTDASPVFQYIAFEVAPAAGGSTPISAAETGSGSEAGAVAASTSASETGTGTDAASVATSRPASETGSGADAGSLAASIPGADLGSGVESGSVAASLPAAETAAGADAGSVAAASSAADTAAGADSGAVLVLVTATDVASGADSASPVTAALLATETVFGAEGFLIAAALTATETGAGLDAGSKTDGSITFGRASFAHSAAPAATGRALAAPASAAFTHGSAPASRIGG